MIVYVPGTMVLNVALPVPGGPPDVLMLKVAGSPLPTPSLVVNVKLPLPPTVFFVTTSRPVASLKVHEPVAAAATVTVTVALVPDGEPGVQLALVSAQPVGTCSVIVYVPGTTVKVALPVPGGPPVVLMLKVAGGPPTRTA